MKRRAVFQLRLTDDEAQRLEDDAKAAGLSKADLIRRGLGWALTARPTRAPSIRHMPAAEKPIDAEKQPGLAAIHALQKRLGRKP